jgi:hypothetical protein
VSTIVVMDAKFLWIGANTIAQARAPLFFLAHLD